MLLNAGPETVSSTPGELWSALWEASMWHSASWNGDGNKRGQVAGRDHGFSCRPWLSQACLVDEDLLLWSRGFWKYSPPVVGSRSLHRNQH